MSMCTPSVHPQPGDVYHPCSPKCTTRSRVMRATETRQTPFAKEVPPLHPAPSGCPLRQVWYGLAVSSTQQAKLDSRQFPPSYDDAVCIALATNGESIGMSWRGQGSWDCLLPSPITQLMQSRGRHPRRPNVTLLTMHHYSPCPNSCPDPRVSRSEMNPPLEHANGYAAYPRQPLATFMLRCYTCPRIIRKGG